MASEKPWKQKTCRTNSVLRSLCQLRSNQVRLVSLQGFPFGLPSGRAGLTSVQNEFGTDWCKSGQHYETSKVCPLAGLALFHVDFAEGARSWRPSGFALWPALWPGRPSFRLCSSLPGCSLSGSIRPARVGSGGEREGGSGPLACALDPF